MIEVFRNTFRNRRHVPKEITYAAGMIPVSVRVASGALLRKGASRL